MYKLYPQLFVCHSSWFIVFSITLHGHSKSCGPWLLFTVRPLNTDIFGTRIKYPDYCTRTRKSIEVIAFNGVHWVSLFTNCTCILSWQANSKLLQFFVCLFVLNNWSGTGHRVLIRGGSLISLVTYLSCSTNFVSLMQRCPNFGSTTNWSWNWNWGVEYMTLYYCIHNR